MADGPSVVVVVTGASSEVSEGWTIGLGATVIDVVVVPVSSGMFGPWRESCVIAVTGDEYTVIDVGEPGTSRESLDFAVCGEKTDQGLSVSEEVVLAMSFCRTLSSVQCR